MGKNKLIDALIFGVIVFLLFFGLFWFVVWLDYSLNKTLIDMMIFPKFEWWSWIINSHILTWIHVNDFKAFLLCNTIIGLIGTGFSEIAYFTI